MKAFPKYEYPFPRCRVCNHKLKPKFIKQQMYYWQNSRPRACCYGSLLSEIGMKGILRVLTVPTPGSLVLFGDYKYHYDLQKALKK